MSKQLTFHLASLEDDDDIRRLLRENPMGGDISLSLEREPSYFYYAGFEGPFHQAAIAREQASQEIVGFASRSIRPYYVNGKVQDIGYLSQLRFTPALRRFYPLRQGSAFFKELHCDQRSPFYLTSIMEDNTVAKRVLAARISGLPRYDEYCRFATHFISCLGKQSQRSVPATIHIENGSAARVSELITFLDRNNERSQFAPVWDEKTMFQPGSTPNLNIDDFLIATEHGEIVGCLALWDQTPFKQAVIRGYSPFWARWRFFVNCGAWLMNKPQLPAPGCTVSHSYLSHISIKEERSDIFCALVNKAISVAQKQKIPLLTLGFATTHPFHRVLEKAYKPFTAFSRIYLVSWGEQDQSPVHQLQNDLYPGFEVALL